MKNALYLIMNVEIKMIGIVGIPNAKAQNPLKEMCPQELFLSQEIVFMGNENF